MLSHSFKTHRSIAYKFLYPLRVVLNATNSKALDKIELGDLKRFAVDKEGE